MNQIEEPLGSSEWALADAPLRSPIRTHRSSHSNVPPPSVRSERSAAVSPSIAPSNMSTRGRRRAEGGTSSSFELRGDDPIASVNQFPESIPRSERKKTIEGNNDRDNIRQRVAQRGQRGQLFDTARSNEKSESPVPGYRVEGEDAAENARKSMGTGFEIRGDTVETPRIPAKSKRGPRPKASEMSVDTDAEAEQRLHFRQKMLERGRGGWSLLPDPGCESPPPKEEPNAPNDTPRDERIATPSRVMRPKVRPPQIVRDESPESVVSAEPESVVSAEHTEPVEVIEDDTPPSTPTPAHVKSIFDLGDTNDADERRRKEKDVYAAELREMMRERGEFKQKEKQKQKDAHGEAGLPPSFGGGRRKWERKRQEEYQRDLQSQMAEARARRDLDHEQQVSDWGGTSSRGSLASSRRK